MIKYKKISLNVDFIIQIVGRTLLKEDNVVFAYLFGGLAHKRVKPLSDIDIAVYLKSAKDLAKYKIELLTRITDSLSTEEVDLVVLNTAPLSLAGRIIENKVILVDNDPFFRHNYESITLRKFFDFSVKERDYFKWRYNIDR